MSLRWLHRKVCTKRELLSLLGYVHHAATVVRPGRIFTRNVIETTRARKWLHHHVLINVKRRAYLTGWAEFLSSAMERVLLILTRDRPSVAVPSDASGSWGCGGLYRKAMVSGCVAHRLARARNCLQGDGPSYARRSHMGRELVVAVCVLNRQIGQRYTVVSAVLQAGKAKDATLLQLLQCIHFYIAILQFSHTAEHIKGKRNTTADNLTARNKLSQILQAASPPPRCSGPWRFGDRRIGPLLGNGWNCSETL